MGRFPDLKKLRSQRVNPGNVWIEDPKQAKKTTKARNESHMVFLRINFLMHIFLHMFFIHCGCGPHFVLQDPRAQTNKQTNKQTKKHPLVSPTRKRMLNICWPRCQTTAFATPSAVTGQRPWDVAWEWNSPILKTKWWTFSKVKCCLDVFLEFWRFLCFLCWK